MWNGPHWFLLLQQKMEEAADIPPRVGVHRSVHHLEVRLLRLHCWPATHRAGSLPTVLREQQVSSDFQDLEGKYYYILDIVIFSWRNLKVRLNLTYRFLQLLLISEISLQETVFPLQQLPRWSLQLRDRSGGEPYLPCTSNFLQIPHQTPRWVFKHKG